LGDLISSFQLSSSGLGYRLFEGQFFDYLKPHQSVDSLWGMTRGVDLLSSGQQHLHCLGITSMNFLVMEN
jgi:hypothetical protein